MRKVRLRSRVGLSVARINLSDIHRENREHHHSQRREQHRQYLTDGRHGKDIGTDSRKVHTGPPDRIAEIVQRRIDFDLVIIKNQSGEIGEHQHRQDVGGQQSRNPIIDDPGEKHIQPQQSPQRGTSPISIASACESSIPIQSTIFK